MTARIYQPARTAMQQGMAARDWVLEYESDQPLVIEPLMGWTSSTDTKTQLRLRFATKEEAVAFATRHGIAFRLEQPQNTAVRPKSYAENFKFGRPDRWTH
jgi:hypothetical protein